MDDEKGSRKSIFISAYCQNYYQEERIRSFVMTQDSNIINQHFNVKKINTLEKNINKTSFKEIDLISDSDEVWILIGALDSNSPENKVKMHSIEENSIKLGKFIRYIYFHQSGTHLGKTKPISREYIFNKDFYKFLKRRESS